MNEAKKKGKKEEIGEGKEEEIFIKIRIVKG